MNFDFSPVVKIPNQRTIEKTNIIVKRGIKGIVRINLDANYFIINIENGLLYRMSKDSYSCKNRLILFYKGLNNGNILKSLKLQKCTMSDVQGYLPFAVGALVEGNLIKEEDKIRFSLKKILDFDEVYKEEKVKAIKFFKDNYEELKDKLNL